MNSHTLRGPKQVKISWFHVGMSCGDGKGKQWKKWTCTQQLYHIGAAVVVVRKVNVPTKAVLKHNGALT